MAKSLRERGARTIDVRFVLGIVLVVASVLGVSALVNSLNRSAPVYVVGTAIATGEPVTLESLRVADLNLGDSVGQYLTPADDLASMIAARPMQPGELVAKTGVTTSLSSDSITTVIAVSGELPSGVDVGRTVDVWAAPDGSMRTEVAVAPAAVLSGVEVVRIAASDGFAAGTSTTVELRISREKLPAVLLAQSKGLSFTVVAVGGAQ